MKKDVQVPEMCKEDDSSLHIFIWTKTDIVGRFLKHSNKMSRMNCLSGLLVIGLQCISLNFKR